MVFNGLQIGFLQPAGVLIKSPQIITLDPGKVGE